MNGPVLFLKADGKKPGSELICSKNKITRLSVKAISHPSIGELDRIALFNNDGVVVQELNTNFSDSICIELDHILIKSQWIAAMAICKNGAVAHTTPIYFIVDGNPTWDAAKAPGIIEKQLKAIQAIEKETKNMEPVDRGILDRLERAKEFYNVIMGEIGE